MADGYQLLADEFDRVVNSPYPTQLKSLRDIICTKASISDITKCVHLRRCRIDDLATRLVEALPQWPYVLDIICKLSLNEVARNAILIAAPTLLCDVLDLSTRKDQSQTRYTEAAEALLSHPLPESYPLPATAQTLFIRLVEQAACTPCAASIKRIYTFLKGTSNVPIGLLSNDTLMRLEEHLNSILRSNHTRSSHDAGDQLLTLHCLAIMHMVANGTEHQPLLSHSFYETQELLASTQPTTPAWNPAEMQKYFVNNNKAPKTIQLVVLQAMWACQSNSASLDDRADTLTLANVLVAAIPGDLRDGWCSSNGALVQKLQQKALACGATYPGLQFQAFGLICQLCKPVFLQGGVVEGVRRAITSLQLPTYAAKGDNSDMLWHCMSATLDQGTISSFLENFINAIVQGSSTSIVTDSDAYVQGLQCISQLACERGEVKEAALAICSAPMFQQKLEILSQVSDLPLRKPHVEGDLSATCSGIIRAAYTHLSHELSVFLLRCGLGVATTDSSVTTSTFDQLLGLHALSARQTLACNHMSQRRELAYSSLVFAEQESTPAGDAADWRSTLQTHFASEARSNEKALSALFARACQDLESRCDGVEQPLREEQEKNTTLQEELDELSEAYAKLEAQTIDRKLHYDALEREIANRLGELDAAREEASGLLQQVGMLEKEVQQARQDAEQMLREARDQKDAAALDSATKIATKTAALEDLQEECEHSRMALQTKYAELEAAREDLETATGSRDSLQVRVDEMEQELQKTTAQLETRECEIADVTQQATAISHELQSVRDELARAQHSHEQEAQRMQEQMRQNAEAANASHNDTMDRLAAKHGEEVASLEHRLSDADKELKRLRRKCEQKDRQIAEANAMRTNLLAALGGGGPQIQLSLPHRTRSSARTQPEDSQIPTPSSAAFGDSEMFDGRASFASNASSGHTQNGPTPKRARPRKLFKVASPAKPRMSMSTRTSRTSTNAGNIAKRRPLGSLSANQSPKKDSIGEPKTPSKGSAVKGDAEFDDSTFDESELFENRSVAKMRDLEAMLEDDTQG